MTTALLPARHGSFVIYRPLRFDVIEIFPLAFSQRYFARRYFSIPLSIVSRSLKIYILCTDDNEYQRCFFRVGRCLHTRVSSVQAIVLIRGDSFFQRLTIARGTGSAGYNTGSLFPTNWKRARHLKRRSNMNPSTRPDLYVFKRNSH